MAAGLYNNSDKIGLLEQANHYLFQEAAFLKEQRERTQVAYEKANEERQATEDRVVKAVPVPPTVLPEDELDHEVRSLNQPEVIAEDLAKILNSAISKDDDLHQVAEKLTPPLQERLARFLSPTPRTLISTINALHAIRSFAKLLIEQEARSKQKLQLRRDLEKTLIRFRNNLPTVQTEEGRLILAVAQLIGGAIGTSTALRKSDQLKNGINLDEFCSYETPTAEELLKVPSSFLTTNFTNNLITDLKPHQHYQSGLRNLTELSRQNLNLCQRELIEQFVLNPTQETFLACQDAITALIDLPNPDQDPSLSLLARGNQEALACIEKIKKPEPELGSTPDDDFLPKAPINDKPIPVKEKIDSAKLLAKSLCDAIRREVVYISKLTSNQKDSIDQFIENPNQENLFNCQEAFNILLTDRNHSYSSTPNSLKWMNIRALSEIQQRTLKALANLFHLYGVEAMGEASWTSKTGITLRESELKDRVSLIRELIKNNRMERLLGGSPEDDGLPLELTLDEVRLRGFPDIKTKYLGDIPSSWMLAHTSENLAEGQICDYLLEMDRVEYLRMLPEHEIAKECEWGISEIIAGTVGLAMGVAVGAAIPAVGAVIHGARTIVHWKEEYVGKDPYNPWQLVKEIKSVPSPGWGMVVPTAIVCSVGGAALGVFVVRDKKDETGKTKTMTLGRIERLKGKRILLQQRIANLEAHFGALEEINQLKFADASFDARLKEYYRTMNVHFH